MWLDPEDSWTTCTGAIYYFEDVHSVSVARHEHYLLGGQSDYHGAGSTRNWYVWNPESNKFVDYGLNMYRGHDQAAFTRIPEDAKIFRTCKKVTVNRGMLTIALYKVRRQGHGRGRQI